jgi:leucyl-tRNA synthetase
VHDQAWPTADTSLLVDETVQVVVQVNGKVRGRVTVPAGAIASRTMAAAARADNVASHLDGEVVKVVVVPDKLVNFVVVRSG